MLTSGVPIVRNCDSAVGGLHDWYSSGGQGVGSEYRYNFGPSSNGNFKTYWLDQKASADDSASESWVSGQVGGASSRCS